MRGWSVIHTSAAALALAIALALPAQAAGTKAALTVIPSKIDPGVRAFDEPNVILAPDKLAAGTPLVVFMPGTGGRPGNTLPLLKAVADQGFRVIGLEYDDEPAVVQVCPRDPDPDCAAAFREMRIYGTGTSKTVSNPVAEAVVPRLVALLKALASDSPGAGWDGYLDGSKPRWERIVVSGLSQGAGMAAFIAKREKVRRVVLFSSPWEYTGPNKRPAPWLSDASATPAARWYAEYHVRENTVPLIKAAYAKLAIPAANILPFDKNLPSNMQRGDNPYHPVTIRDTRYLPQWQQLFGQPGDSAE